MTAHDRYRQAMSELMLHGGRVAELAEIVDEANSEIVGSLLAALAQVESKADETDQRLQRLERAVVELKSKSKPKRR
jgi:hypothetical protein